MPQLDKRLEDKDMLLRELVYGPAKSKKTWWVGKAAEAGYNVLLLDGDDGWHILTQIKPEARKRIQVMDLNDDLNKVNFSTFMARLLKTGTIVWDEEKKKSAKLNPNANCVSIDLNKMGKHDLLVVDSWTALIKSLMWQYAIENTIDLSEADKSDWDFYGWGGRLALWMLDRLASLNCHLVVIAHATIYEKRSKDGKKVISQKRQIISTSGPNAMQIPSKFSDVLYFYPKGSAFKIDTKGTDEADGGSRLVPPGVYNWDDLQFVDLIKAAGLDLPPVDNPFIDYAVAVKEPVKPRGGLIKTVAKPTAKLKLG